MTAFAQTAPLPLPAGMALLVVVTALVVWTLTRSFYAHRMAALEARMNELEFVRVANVEALVLQNQEDFAEAGRRARRQGDEPGSVPASASVRRVAADVAAVPVDPQLVVWGRELHGRFGSSS